MPVCLVASNAGHYRPCSQYHLNKTQELKIPASDIEQVIAIAKEINISSEKHMVEFTQLKISDWNKK